MPTSGPRQVNEIIRFEILLQSNWRYDVPTSTGLMIIRKCGGLSGLGNLRREKHIASTTLHFDHDKGRLPGPIALSVTIIAWGTALGSWSSQVSSSKCLAVQHHVPIPRCLGLWLWGGQGTLGNVKAQFGIWSLEDHFSGYPEEGV